MLQSPQLHQDINQLTGDLPDEGSRVTPRVRRLLIGKPEVGLGIR